jgi:SAM-dependent methyltransferase
VPEQARTWESQRAAWQRIPVDVAYVSAEQLLVLPDDDLAGVVLGMEAGRYSGWRNPGNRWRLFMGLDNGHGRVLDYGCGLGMESLQYAKSGNDVSVADINAASVQLAARVLRLSGYEPQGTYVISEEQSVSATDGSFDLVVMNGVLHHIERPYRAVREAYRLLRAGGELRVMVYTDLAWRLVTGTEPPPDVSYHPSRLSFVRWGDEIGDWADWYSPERLRDRFGALFRLSDWQYITEEGHYGVGIMVKNGQ